MTPYQIPMLPLLLIPPHMFIQRSFKDETDDRCRLCNRPLFSRPDVHTFGAPMLTTLEVGE